MTATGSTDRANSDALASGIGSLRQLENVVPQLVAVALGYPYIHVLMGIPALLVIGVALYAVWRTRFLPTPS